MATTEQQAEAPPKTGKGGMIVMIVVGLLAVAAGFAVPRMMTPGEGTKKVEKKERKPVVLPFGDIVVSLGEERHNRYLRLKILLVIDGNDEKTTKEHVEKQKAFLKSWLIGYLSDLSLSEVSRAAGVNRLRREIRDQFNLLLWPDGQELVLEVLFDEFVVQ